MKVPLLRPTHPRLLYRPSASQPPHQISTAKSLVAVACSCPIQYNESGGVQFQFHLWEERHEVVAPLSMSPIPFKQATYRRHTGDIHTGDVLKPHLNRIGRRGYSALLSPSPGQRPTLLESSNLPIFRRVRSQAQ